MIAEGIDNARVLWAMEGRRVSESEALAGLTHRPLLLVMHGFGSFEGDLIELAPHLPHGFVIASPRAPLVAPPPIVNGYSWWPLEIDTTGVPVRREDPKNFLGSDPHTAATVVLAWLDELAERVAALPGAAGSGLGTVALMGFSQGACMVTSLMRLQPERFACGVNCSGFVAPGAFEDDSRIAELRPPMFWGRDEADPIIDSARIALTDAWSAAHTSLEAHLYDGILHGIGAEELQDITSFLHRHVPELAAVGR